MKLASLRSGTCPSCERNDVYTNAGLAHRGGRTSLGTPGSSMWVDTYICLECGHFEEIIRDGDLATNAAAIRAEWRKAT